MKLALLLILFNVVNSFASVYSQKVSLDLQNVKFEDAIREISYQTNIDIAYSKEIVDMNRLVSISAANSDLKSVLDQLLAGTQLLHIELNGKIYLGPKTLESLIDASIFKQQLKITGSVIDSLTGEAIIGANILIEGTNTGVISDANGNFSIVVPNTNSVLVFSYIGYVTQKIPINGLTKLDIRLQSDIQSLEEIVVIGYGTQKKVNLTGSVVSVDTKMLESRPVANIVQSLQGVVPGLNITQTSGEVGTSATINIRGITTIGQGSNGNPLVLVDGMEGDINTVNPQDVENISVLKDAASSSIYGSRAPFGVILITTKQGKAGRTQVSYSNSFRYIKPLHLPEMANSYNFALFINEMRKNAGYPDWISADWIEKILQFQAGELPPTTFNGVDHPTTLPPARNNPNLWESGYNESYDNRDWVKTAYKPSAIAQEHSLSASGGNEKYTFYISGNYLSQPGLLKLGDDGYKRYNLSTKINAKLTNWLSVNYSGRLENDKWWKPNNNLAMNGFWFSRAWPTVPLYDPNGFEYGIAGSGLPSLYETGGTQTQKYARNYQQFNVTIEPLKDWKIFGNLNYKVINGAYDFDYLTIYNHDVNGNPYAVDNFNTYVSQRASNETYFAPNVYTEYSKNFGEHNLVLVAGYQAEIDKYTQISAKRNGLIVPSQTVLDMTTGQYNGIPQTPGVGGYNYTWSTAGYFGRLNYNYKGKYLVEFTLREDGSSRFRSDKRWNLLPSGSIGWNIAHEAFWDNLSRYINELKPRFSYGALGNTNIKSIYPTYPSMGFASAAGGWLLNGVKPNISSAPLPISSSLTWETVRSYNAALDLGAFNNRFTSTFEYFVRYTDDMVGPAPELPNTFGTTVPITNNTNLKTYGWDLSLKWEDHLSNGLDYNLSFVLSDNNTIILSYPNPTGQIGMDPGMWGNGITYTTYHSGEKYGEIWGYETIGIAKTDEEMDAHIATLPNGGQNAVSQGTVTPWSAGDIMYKEINGDGKISPGARTVNDHGDLKVIGNITPHYLFGANFGMNWKGFDLNAFFQGVLKWDYFQDSYWFWGNGTSMWMSVLFKQHEDYFRPEGTTNPLGPNVDAYYPRPIDGNWNGMGKNHEVQTKYMQNAAYVRLKNLQIGYTIPASITEKIKFSKIRIYVSGENILTFTKMSDLFDPETINQKESGGFAYPLSKIYAFGINVTF